VFSFKIKLKQFFKDREKLRQILLTNFLGFFCEKLLGETILASAIYRLSNGTAEKKLCTKMQKKRFL
jgi:hypothetical protein